MSTTQHEARGSGNHIESDRNEKDPSIVDPNSTSASKRTRRTLIARFPNGDKKIVNLVIDGCLVERVGGHSHSDIGKKKSRSRNDSMHEGKRSGVPFSEPLPKWQKSNDTTNGDIGKDTSFRAPSSSDQQRKISQINRERRNTHSHTITSSKATPLKEEKSVQHILGDDGNLYYCALCLDVGDVVCCDGCPRVYHPKCIPVGCESRLSLDADDDPWYCPDCMSAGKGNTSTGRPRRRRASSLKETAPSPPKEQKQKRKRGRPSLDDRKKKMRKESYTKDSSPVLVEHTASNQVEIPIVDEAEEESGIEEEKVERTESGIVRAVQPFFHYLWDNRLRLERKLGRKDKSFKRAPKGYEKNLIVAREGYSWWKSASDQERKRYLAYAIDEFAENVVLWKQEEIIREMIEMIDMPDAIETSTPDKNVDDEKYWKKKADKLFSLSRISCNSSKTQENTIMMELLQDTRFHPLPMVQPNREPIQGENPDYAHTTVPYFNVQGPIATSVGDQCIGCTRGWNHFCPILKRQFPAVEYRGKLQPPYPSLLATRVGMKSVAKEDIVENMVYMDGLKRHKDVPSYPLTNPTSCNDDVMDFVEKLVAVKMCSKNKRSANDQNQISFRSSSAWKDEDNNKQKSKLFICGKCKSTVRDQHGCISCRRALLLVQSATKVDSHKFRSSPRIQSTMLVRAGMKTEEYDDQTQDDKKMAKALSTKPWKPNTIMPEYTKVFTAKAKSKKVEYESLDEESSKNMDDDASSSSNDDIIQKGDEFSVDGLKKQSLRRHARRGTVSSDADSGAESRAREVAYKEESAKLQERCLSIATSGILLGLIRRDPLRLFAEPVPINVESYYNIIKEPIDFSKIKAKVFAKEYNTLGAFASDIKLLCTNSLVYNPPGTIYAVTAHELRNAFDIMQKRASDWMAAIKNAHASFYSRKGRNYQKKRKHSVDIENDNEDDPFVDLRKNWPGAIEILEEGSDWTMSQLEAEYVRTKENETAYYGALAIRRAAASAEASLGSMYNTIDTYQSCIRRSPTDDEKLRDEVDKKVASVSSLAKLQTFPSWREGDVLGLMKKVQKWRVDKKTSPDNLCGRCVTRDIHLEAKLTRYAESQRKRRRMDDIQTRVAKSRKFESTGMASKKERERVAALDKMKDSQGESSVTVRGSQIQGWGLYADHSFQKGEVVAEYVGEYVVNPVTDQREKLYAENRIQDYQFRVSANFVIDATKHGGFARYINHSCDPNCVAKIIDGDAPNQHLKRVIVSSQRAIEAGEEITYDYQFPIENDLDARLPCSCGAKNCRGFMNWDLPESSSLIARARTSRGRKERIRNLVRKDLSKGMK